MAYSAAFLCLLHLWRSHPAFLDDPRILLGGAVLLRLTLLPALPDLSDDLYRYVWDGWVSLSGINPFQYAPAHPELASLHDSVLFREMNSPEYHSIYPPLSQVVFLLGGAVYGLAGWPAAAYAVKVGFVVLEVAGIACLFLALRSLGHRPGALALYAWNPLVLVAVAGNGHTEGGLTLGLGLLALGVAADRRRLAWVGLALAVLSKGIPLLLAPLLLRLHLGEVGWRGTLRAAAPGTLVGAALLAPFYFPGMLALVAGSADLYVRLFEFNAGPYFLLREASLALTGDGREQELGPALRWAFLGVAVIVWVRWPLRRRADLFPGAILIFGLYLATATTVHPWYLLWGLALIPFTPFLRAAWLWASWAAFLTYFFYTGVSDGLLAGVFWGGAGFFVLREAERPIRDRLLRVAGRRKAGQVAPHLRGRRILDLGAGEGYVARALGRRDPARHLLLMDVGAFFRTDLPGIVYDGHTIPLADGSVDTVLLSLALHHAEDPDRVLEEALRVSRRRVVVTESTYRHGWERTVLEWVDGWANRGRGGTSPEPETLGFRTVPAWEDAVRRAGGRLLRSERLNRVGHRHHLFVIERQNAENPGKSSASSPSGSGGPPPLAR